MARTQPTIVASSPTARCRKPPTLAFAYISPARSSKRRISSIAASHSRASSSPSAMRSPYPGGRALHRLAERDDHPPQVLELLERLGVSRPVHDGPAEDRGGEAGRA